MKRSEKALLLIMLVVSGYMWIDSYSFISRVALFPRFTTTATIIFVVLLLAQNVLPKPLAAFVTEPVNLAGDAISDERSDVDMGNNPVGDVREDDLHRPLSNSLFTVFAVIGYSGLAYLFGILWISPIFIAAYTSWFGLSRKITAALSTFSFVLALAFMFILNVRLDRGLLFGGL